MRYLLITILCISSASIAMKRQEPSSQDLDNLMEVEVARSRALFEFLRQTDTCNEQEKTIKKRAKTSFDTHTKHYALIYAVIEGNVDRALFHEPTALEALNDNGDTIAHYLARLIAQHEQYAVYSMPLGDEQAEILKKRLALLSALHTRHPAALNTPNQNGLTPRDVLRNSSLSLLQIDDKEIMAKSYNECAFHVLYTQELNRKDNEISRAPVLHDN